MCENEATVFLTQIIDGKMTQVNLCDKCSKEKGVTDPTGFQLADFLMGTAQKKSKSSGGDEDTLACPNCGFTRAHLKKIGRMGCPQCYDTFADDLESMLRAMHKGTRHVGKTPTRQELIETPAPKKKTTPVAAAPPPPPVPPTPPAPPSPPTVEEQLSELKLAIELAIEEERYEDAAKLRDEMRDLESKVI